MDAGERLEIALAREIEEEVGLTVADLRYVCSEVNDYPFAGVIYPVVDCIFTGKVTNPEAARPLDGVAGIEWRALDAVRDEELAFPSIRI